MNVEYDNSMTLICFRLRKKAYVRYESQNYEVAKVIWSRGEEVLVTWPYSEMKMEQLDCAEKLKNFGVGPATTLIGDSFIRFYCYR